MISNTPLWGVLISSARPSERTAIASRPSGDPEDGVVVGDALEVTEGRTAVDREERTCSGGQLEVTAQDRGTLIGEVFHRGNVFTPSASQHRAAVGAQVTHPVRPLAEHGHQIALALIVHDNYRERNQPS